MNKRKEVKVRVNEFDTRTSSDLKHSEFSGIRANDLMNQFEIWILGNVEKTVPYAEFWVNEQSLTQAYCLVFGLREATVSGAVEDAIKQMRYHKQQVEQLSSSDEGKRLLDSLGKEAKH